jgi:hypothetical protein
MTNTNTKRLDNLTRKTTAFTSWAALTAACATGYVPTTTSAALAAALCGAGYRVWGR